ncbi:MAG: hypothetical protein WCG27_07950, partial [Pseudomonadota bacterium]
MIFRLYFYLLLIPFVSHAQTNTFSTCDLSKIAYSKINFRYYRKEDRLEAISDLFRSIELEYVLLPFKQKIMGLDFKRLNEETLARENNINEITINVGEHPDATQWCSKSFFQASSNLDFLDRARAYVARFQDSHFSISSKIPMPLVYNGLRLTRIGNKIMVSGKNSNIKASGIGDISNIPNGDEILEIDGRPVMDTINELKKYISASSEDYRNLRAVKALTIRNFKFPEKNYQDITFAQAGKRR